MKRYIFASAVVVHKEEVVAAAIRENLAGVQSIEIVTNLPLHSKYPHRLLIVVENNLAEADIIQALRDVTGVLYNSVLIHDVTLEL